MIKRRRSQLPVLLAAVLAVVATLVTATSLAQLPDRTINPNTANEGIAKSFTEQIGAGRGSTTTPNSSRFIIARDPFRAVRRGRQIFSWSSICSTTSNLAPVKSLPKHHQAGLHSSVSDALHVTSRT